MPFLLNCTQNSRAPSAYYDRLVVKYTLKYIPILYDGIGCSSTKAVRSVPLLSSIRPYIVIAKASDSTMQKAVSLIPLTVLNVDSLIIASLINDHQKKSLFFQYMASFVRNIYVGNITEAFISIQVAFSGDTSLLLN